MRGVRVVVKGRIRGMNRKRKELTEKRIMNKREKERKNKLKEIQS